MGGHLPREQNKVGEIALTNRLHLLFVSLLSYTLMHRIIAPIILFFFLLPAFTSAQTDLLVLKNKGMDVRTYTVGTDLTMKTIYDQWFQGTITDMRHDSIFVNGQPFHYKEIAAILRMTPTFSNTVLAAGMMVTGAGMIVLGAVNGAYRGDKSKDWYTSSSLILAPALIVGGYLLTKTRHKTYRMGRKYTLDYLVLTPDKK